MNPASVVKLCYFLDRSKNYGRIKRICHDLLENPQAPVRPYVDTVMITLILTTVLLFIYDVRHPLPDWARHVEYIAVGVFIIEYLLRLWLYSDSRRIIIADYEKADYLGVPFRLGPALGAALRKKWDYATTPLAIIDLLSLLPAYRPLRILRLFMLFRVFRLFRYAHSVNEFTRVLAEKRFELYTLGVFVSFVVFASATAIYLFEADHSESRIETFFDAVYWALVTLSTVGYGDIVPHTPEGRLITAVLIVSGIGVLSFFTSIIVSAFAEKMQTLRERRIQQELARLDELIVVCGYGRVGEVIVAQLVAQGRALLVLDKVPARVERARRQGFHAVCEDAGRSGLWESLGIQQRVETVLCVTGDDVINVFATLTARSLNPQVKIISRANRDETVKKLKLAGANYVVRPFDAVARVAVGSVHEPLAFAAIHAVLSGDSGLTLDAIRIGDGTYLDGQRLARLDLRQHKLVLFGVIAPRAGERHLHWERFDLATARFYFNPPDDFVLHGGDSLVLFGRPVSLRYFQEQLEQSALRGR